MANVKSSVKIRGSTFKSNSSSRHGGGIYNERSSSHISNTAFTTNSSFYGGAIHNEWNSVTSVVNSILWENNGRYGSQIYNNYDSSPAKVTYSVIQGGYSGEGNTNIDPLFVDSDSSDFHLQTGSPAINTGNNAAIPTDTIDLDNDGNTSEPIPLDLDGNARVIAGTVDMGPYEYDGE